MRLHHRTRSLSIRSPPPWRISHSQQKHRHDVETSRCYGDLTIGPCCPTDFLEEYGLQDAELRLRRSAVGEFLRRQARMNVATGLGPVSRATPVHTAMRNGFFTAGPRSAQGHIKYGAAQISGPRNGTRLSRRFGFYFFLTMLAERRSATDQISWICIVTYRPDGEAVGRQCTDDGKWPLPAARRADIHRRY
jgi:hypothetical protein